ncbi:valine--tRNA ligase [Fulvivirgaceae bacterium LMO-SS25]
MSIASKYNPAEVEDKWYKHWMDQKFFHAQVNPEKEPYTIVIPPPNVTGVLHMGHMLNNTIQDVLIRKARMEGKEACWVPGTDHASIATEAKVVAMLREKGIKKSEIGRDEFMKYAWEWKEKYGGIILEQLKKLGASCDWDRTSFTMDEGYYKAVVQVFVDLYRKGFIYRDLRMINWDCEAKTALSNEEVMYKEDGEKSVLYHIRYQIKDSKEFVVIATQRPETIMGDTGIAVNPKDPRFTHLIGKKAIVPFINREIPIIADEYVELDFGSGCLKITPAHDPNDYELGKKHNLEVIDTINLDGTLNEKCEMPEYVGKDRFIVRKMIVKKMREAELLEKEEDFITKIGRSERTNTVVEPKLSLQWFIKMKEISRTALKAVEEDEIQLHPPKFKNTYRHWMENVKDWCISRQLWWGHRIPAWFLPNGDFVVANTEEEALKLAQEKSPNITLADLKQDEDVLDTWASSWLWPMAVFNGFENFDEKSGRIEQPNAELAYFYPTKVLVTAPEILFFWVARMIIAGYEYMGEMPFKDVYLTGIVRDKQGRKMSKSLGNSPDPIELMQKYGADGVRTGMLFSSPAGNDLPFDEKLCEQGRNFSNKIWNAFRLLKGLDVVQTPSSNAEKVAIQWMENRLNQALVEIEDHYGKYRISDALMGTYKLIWDDYCAWFLEMIKPAYGDPISEETLNSSIAIFEKLLKVLHPFMPFITEELWHSMGTRGEKDCIIVAEWPKAATFDKGIIDAASLAFELISQIRNIRSSKGISPKEPLELIIKTEKPEAYSQFQQLIEKLGNLSSIQFNGNAPEMSFSFIINSDECAIPAGNNVDLEKEKAEMLKELEYAKGFLNSVMKKLGNERFVNNAPAQVLQNEQNKKADAEAKIKTLEESLAKMG